MPRKKKIKVFMGIPSTGERSDAQLYSLRIMEQKYKDRIQFIYPEQCVYRFFHDFARNAMVEEFLKSKADILWFLDADIAPCTDVLDIVADHHEEWLAAGAPYPVWMGNKVVMCVYGDHEEMPGALRVVDVPTKGTGWVGGLATGCLFLKREIFTDIVKPPYFEFKYDPESKEMIEGEDLGFCMKLAEKGVKFFVDFSKPCKHYKKVDLLEVNNYAIEFSNANVKAYDATIRPQVAQLVNAIAEKNEIIESLSKGPGHTTKSGLYIP